MFPGLQADHGEYSAGLLLKTFGPDLFVGPSREILTRQTNFFPALLFRNELC
jgi:hypothetical protein